MNDAILEEQVYLDYKDKVYSYIRGKVSNDDVEDLLSSVFLKVYQNLDRFDSSKASLSTWIYTITHNEVCNYYRGKTNQGALVDIEAVLNITNNTEPFIEKLIREEEIEALANALEKLPERERDIIVLRFYHGYSPAEVGRLMKISYSNAKFLQHRAIGKLKKLMVD
ncbi:MAG: sigma-70 family RNA polymerase sigma factor [Tissierellia bacterium]|nr:sigma-70 family RNA polymerase sigma factor [Tissierellia bacterium]MDD4726619.1 sigma-70 family RNA polymerase sigma factor [Tissierellia bacterium]